MARTRRKKAALWWEELPQEELLDVRLRDLELRIEGTVVEARLERLFEELARQGIRFRPYAWLSTDWFTPDGATGFAIPFYLAHRRLARLEHSKMLAVEGGNSEYCMKLLRHESAHAIDNAYRLHRRKRWREVFGYVSTPYRASYAANPLSRKHVINLEYWYSQSHPSEDYAETFAVWLQPGSLWRKRYEGWPALRKLEFIEELMGEIGGRAAPVRTRRRVEPLRTSKITLREYYRRKKAAYEIDLPSTYDEPLLRIFSTSGRTRRRETASSFLRRMRRELCRRVAAVTGQQHYLVDQVLNDLIPSCRRLGLRVSSSQRQTLLDVSILLTFLSSRFLHGHHPRYRR